MIGAGALAPHLVRRSRRCGPIRRVTLWTAPRRAISVAFGLHPWPASDVAVAEAEDLKSAVREADIVCCATSGARR